MPQVVSSNRSIGRNSFELHSQAKPINIRGDRRWKVEHRCIGNLCAHSVTDSVNDNCVPYDHLSLSRLPPSLSESLCQDQLFRIKKSLSLYESIQCTHTIFGSTMAAKRRLNSLEIQPTKYLAWRPCSHRYVIFYNIFIILWFLVWSI